MADDSRGSRSTSPLETSEDGNLTNQDKIKSLWMDAVLEKKDPNQAQAMIQQLPYVLQLIEKAVEKGYIQYCNDKENQEHPSSSNQQSLLRYYDKVIYIPNVILKKWYSRINTDFTLKYLKVRPCPEKWLKKESKFWKKSSQVILTVNEKWNTQKVIEIVSPIVKLVSCFKIIIPSCRKDAIEFCQTLIKMDIQVAICSSSNDCEKAIQSIEQSLTTSSMPSPLAIAERTPSRTSRMSTQSSTTTQTPSSTTRIPFTHLMKVAVSPPRLFPAFDESTNNQLAMNLNRTQTPYYGRSM
jgi:hypothetical protein